MKMSASVVPPERIKPFSRQHTGHVNNPVRITLNVRVLTIAGVIADSKKYGNSLCPTYEHRADRIVDNVVA